VKALAPKYAMPHMRRAELDPGADSRAVWSDPGERARDQGQCPTRPAREWWPGGCGAGTGSQES